MQRQQRPSELLILSIMEPSWGQQKSCSQTLQATASTSIPSQRHKQPSLPQPRVLLSLPVKDKATEPAGNKVLDRFTPGKVQLNHP